MRKPEWLHVNAGNAAANAQLTEMLRSLDLNTVCEEADCPNMNECFSRKTATFMILGSNCTRNCTFCSVRKGSPDQVDPQEPDRIASAVRTLGLKYVVVTSVTRDDLPDGGAGHFAAVIETVRNVPAKIEVLIPDFQGDAASLHTVIEARPDVLNHNVETVPRLYPEVRPMADYQRSLELLRRVRVLDPGMRTKSGIMLGLGETEEEVIRVFGDLLECGCNSLTIGQYLAPSRMHHPVVEYVEPAVFSKLREKALNMGFKHVLSGPLVRSSYHADANGDGPSLHFP